MNTFHPSTDKLIELLRKRTPQSLLLTGITGVGLSSVGYEIAKAGIIRHEVKPDATKATPIITVEMIRELYDNSRSKSTDKQFIIIHDADAMSAGAQAAFLKLLEEPAPSVHFILTSSRRSGLLPTIQSRVRHHAVQPITTEQSMQLIESHGFADPTKQRQMLFIANGLPEELERLMADEEYFTASATLMVDARTYIQAEPYQKLLIAHKYKDDRSGSLQLVRAALRIVRRSVSDRPDVSFIPKLEQLISIEEGLMANGNIRLQLSRFVV